MSRLQQIKAMLEKEPDDSFLNYALALEYVKDKQADKAISIISGILKRDEDYLGAYYQLGKLYEQAADAEQARLTYQKGMEVAKRKRDSKTLGELNEALMMLDDQD